MKSSKLIMGCLAALGLSAGMSSAQAEVDRDAIAERLAPVGELCLQGDDCGTSTAAASGGDSGSEGGLDGESIYGSVCSACHESGAAGAPVRGDEDGWAERVDKGWDELLANAINGIGNMPAKGGNSSLADEEVEAAMAHLLEPVMDVPEVGGDAAAEGEASDEATSEDEAASDEQTAANEDEAASEDGAASEDEAASDDGENATADSGGDSGLDGEALYGSSGCAACHDSGAAGAPMLGDAEAWAARIEKGAEELYSSAINGIGAMPPKGGSSASDEEVQAIVDYMISEAE